MLKFPILKKMVRKPTSKVNKDEVEVEVEVESPKTPKTPEHIDDTTTTPPTFTPAEQEDATIWSSSFSWNMQTTSSEFGGSAAMNNVWNEENKHSSQLDITKKNEILEDKDDFEENVWTDVQIVAGMPNNQSIFSVPFIIPDSPTILKPHVENVSINSENDESTPSYKEVVVEGENIRKDSSEVTNSENSDYVDLGKDNFSSSKELSKEFDEFTNPDIKLESNNNEILYENKEFDEFTNPDIKLESNNNEILYENKEFDEFEQYENEKLENIIINEEKEDDADFGAFECGEENESGFDDFGEFKSENINNNSNQGNQNFSLDVDGDFDLEKNENIFDDDIAQNLGPDLEHFKTVTNSVAGWIAALDKIYGSQISNESSDNEKPISIEDLVYNSHVMMNTNLNWSSFIKLLSDQGGVIKFSWRGSQIRKAFLESVNPISSIKTADRLPGSDLFNDDRSPTSSFSPTPNFLTHDDKTKQEEENSMDALFINTNDNVSIRDVPEESIGNNDNKSTDSNRDSWITMSDISFLESFSSRPSSVSSTKKSRRKSEALLDDFLDIKTPTTSSVSNSRIDSVMAKISRNSTNLSAKFGSLKSHVFGGSNDILIPIEESRRSSTNVKSPIPINLLDDPINDTTISKKTDEKKNSNGFHITPVKNKDTSTFSSELLFGDMISAASSNDSSQQTSSSFNNSAASKLNYDDLLKTSDDTKKNSTLLSEFDETVPTSNDNDSNTNKFGNQKQQDNWISSTDFSFLESFTNNNSKHSSSSSRKSQQNAFFDLSEFDLNLSSNIQPPKTSETFLQSIINKENSKINNNVSKVKHEKQSENIFNSDSKQLYSSSMNASSTSISSEFGEMVSANDTNDQNLQDDWMLNTSTNQDNWISNSGLSFLETLKTSSNNNNSNNNNNKPKKNFGDLDEFIFFK